MNNISIYIGIGLSTLNEVYKLEIYFSLRDNNIPFIISKDNLFLLCFYEDFTSITEILKDKSFYSYLYFCEIRLNSKNGKYIINPSPKIINSNNNEIITWEGFLLNYKEGFWSPNKNVKIQETKYEDSLEDNKFFPINVTPEFIHYNMISLGRSENIIKKFLIFGVRCGFFKDEDVISQILRYI